MFRPHAQPIANQNLENIVALASKIALDSNCGFCQILMRIGFYDGHLLLLLPTRGLSEEDRCCHSRDNFQVCLWIGLLMTTFPLSTKKMRNKPGPAAFSLVEVVLALGVVSFGLISLMGLLTVGLKTFHEAMGATTKAEIAQRLANQLQLASYSAISTNTTASYYYFTEEGLATNASGGIYSARIDPPTKFTVPGGDSTAAANTLKVVIYIWSKNSPQATNAVPIQIANNGS